MSDSPQTLDDFLRVLRSSGLVDPDRIDAELAPWRDGDGAIPLGAEPVPDAFVAALVDGGLQIGRAHV